MFLVLKLDIVLRPKKHQLADQVMYVSILTDQTAPDPQESYRCGAQARNGVDLGLPG